MLFTHYAGCPLCDSKSTNIGEADCSRHPLWHDALPTTLSWYQCQTCAHVFTAHYWTPDGLNEVFRRAHGNQQADIQNADAKRATWLPVVQNAMTHLGGYRSALLERTPATWLDVGCGDGALVMTASDLGFKAIGLDARKETVAKLQQLGFKAHQGDFITAGMQGQVNVISMMDVLEHMPYPKQALHKAHQVLAPGGLIIISLPDLGCSAWKLMNAANANPYWGELEHHHNFSRQRLMTLLEEQGFEVQDATIPRRYKAQIEVYAKKVT